MNVNDLWSEYKSLGIGEQLDYDKFALYSIITHSTAIEGSTISEVENQVLFDKGISPNKPIAEQLMNLDLKAAYGEAFRIADARSPVTVAVLCQLAAQVMKNTGSRYSTALGEFDAAKGELRHINVSAGRGGASYMAWQKVPDRLQAFCTWLDKTRKALDSPGLPQEREKLSIRTKPYKAHPFVVNIMPIMCPCQQGRGFWEGLFRMVRSAWTILYMLWQGGASHTVRIHRLKIMG